MQESNQISLSRMISGSVEVNNGMSLLVTSTKGADLAVKVSDDGACVDITWQPDDSSSFAAGDVSAKLYIKTTDGQSELACDYIDRASLEMREGMSLDCLSQENEQLFNARKSCIEVLGYIGREASNVLTAYAEQLAFERQQEETMRREADERKRGFVDEFSKRHERLSVIEASNIIKILKKQADEKNISEKIRLLLLDTDGGSHHKGLQVTKTGTSQYFWFTGRGKIVPEKDVPELISNSWKEKD
ncbi:hypothetical protein VCHA53O466_50437 [Vibrio chagasii]|nr:hypothetical protein VCHA53O466_50437 [Vibrio chagasii]